MDKNGGDTDGQGSDSGHHGHLSQQRKPEVHGTARLLLDGMLVICVTPLVSMQPHRST